MGEPYTSNRRKRMLGIRLLRGVGGAVEGGSGRFRRSHYEVVLG